LRLLGKRHCPLRSSLVTRRRRPSPSEAGRAKSITDAEPSICDTDRSPGTSSPPKRASAGNLRLRASCAYPDLLLASLALRCAALCYL
jgi:hypothetical protein